MHLPSRPRGRAVLVGRTSLLAALFLLATYAFPPASTTVRPGESRAAQASPPASPSETQSCTSRPSACGYPDATNTGVPPGTPLTRVDGTVYLNTPGATFSNREVHGVIVVGASNVTIEKVRVITSGYYPIQTFGGANDHPTGTVVRDVEIDFEGAVEQKGIAFSNYTATRVWWHNGMDCAHFVENVTITDSFCDLSKLPPGSSAHADGFQSDGGSNITLRHNTIRNPNSQTSAILMSTNTAPIDDVVIGDNLMSGGGYTVYCGTDEGGVATNATYTNNRISREFFPNGGRWAPTTWCDRVAVNSGNGWDRGMPPAPRLSGAGAKRSARAALARQLGRRYTRRAGRLRLTCARRSRSVMACRASWTAAGPRGRTRRYAGRVVVTRVAANRRRYSLRIRGRSRGCGCSRLIERTGFL